MKLTLDLSQIRMHFHVSTKCLCCLWLPLVFKSSDCFTVSLHIPHDSQIACRWSHAMNTHSWPGNPLDSFHNGPVMRSFGNIQISKDLAWDEMGLMWPHCNNDCAMHCTCNIPQIQSSFVILQAISKLTNRTTGNKPFEDRIIYPKSDSPKAQNSSG